MKQRKICYYMIFFYLAIQIVGILFNNYLNIQTNSFVYLISNFLIQILVAIFIIYNVSKFFRWKDIGFGKIHNRNLYWFLPYMFIILSMLYTFLISIYQNIQSYNSSIWISLFLIFIATTLSGFCEEVLFRGILLNTFKKENSLIKGMIISSIGFSIFHITTVFIGKSLFLAISNVIYASLLGFAFVALSLKINNIWPLIIYHSLWNYILIISDMLDISLSQASYYNNFLNIAIAIFLWIDILRKEKNKKRSIFSR